MSFCTAALRVKYAGLALIGLLMFGLAASSRADITLSFEPKGGDKVSDIFKVVLKAESPDGIDKVEFLVDGMARATRNGVPYFYEWDTISDPEGEHTITATAYDSNGNTKKAEIKLVIDNELAQGAGPLAQKALDALAKKDYDTTTRYARRSLKAEPGNANGSRALAAVYASRQDWSRAADLLDKAKNIDVNAPAMADLASYKMHRALQPESAATFVSDYRAVSVLRRKSADLTVKELEAKYAAATGAEAVQSHEIIGDALVAAGRFRDAAGEYNKNVSAGDAPITSINRLALAYLLADQYAEAMGVVRPAVRAKKDDIVTRAVYGLVLLRQRKFAEARQMVGKDIDDKKTAVSLIVASYADAALDQKKEATAEAKSALELVPDAPEAHYALSLATADLQVAERELNHTLATEPFFSGPYLAYAANIALGKRLDRYDQALGIASAILQDEPDNVFAKILSSLVDIQKGDSKSAAPFLTLLARREQTSPDVLATLAVYWNNNNGGPQTVAALKSARELDRNLFDFQQVPEPMELLELLNRKLHYRAGFFLSPSTLYPPKAQAAATADAK